MVDVQIIIIIIIMIIIICSESSPLKTNHMPHKVGHVLAPNGKVEWMIRPKELLTR